MAPGVATLFAVVVSVLGARAAATDACLHELLEAVAASRRPPVATHPDLASAEAIVPGATIHLDRAVTAILPRLLHKVSAWPLPVTVLERRADGESGRWRNSGDVTYVYGTATGKFGIPTNWLTSHGFVRDDYLSRSPFSTGEIVMIGHTEEPRAEVRSFVLAKTETAFRIMPEVLPLPAHFLRLFDEHRAVVELSVALPDELSVIVVPRDRLFGVPTGTVARFRERLKPLLDLPLEFSSGEPVRYRDRHGKIATARFKEKDGGMAVLTDPFGRRALAPLRQVFKWDGKGDPYTPVFETNWFKTHGVKPGSLYALALDAAARLTSHPRWLRAPMSRRLAWIATLSRVILEPSEEATHFPVAGLDTMDKVLISGMGDCKYEAELAATIASEAGYRTTLVRRVPRQANQDGLRIGHVWAEVHSDRDPSEGWFLDPAFALVQSLGTAPSRAARDPGSTPGEWYLHRGRRYVDTPAR